MTKLSAQTFQLESLQRKLLDLCTFKPFSVFAKSYPISSHPRPGQDNSRMRRRASVRNSAWAGLDGAGGGRRKVGGLRLWGRGVVETCCSSGPRRSARVPAGEQELAAIVVHEHGFVRPDD